MHFKWLRKHRSGTSDDGDAKGPAAKTAAHATTREAELGPPSTRELRSHYRKTFDYQSRQIVKDSRNRTISVAGGHDVRCYECLILQCCRAVSSCLLEEWLTSKQPARSEKVHGHVDAARGRLCAHLVAIARTAANRRDFQRPGQNLVKSFVAVAVSATSQAALDAGTALDFESSTMALSHSLLAAAHQIAEYIAHCHAQGKDPSTKEARALLPSSSDARGPEVPRATQSSSVLTGNSDTLLGSPEAASECASSLDPSLERPESLDRPETASLYTSRCSSSSTLSATARSGAEEYIGLVGQPSNTSEAATFSPTFCRSQLGKGLPD